MCAQSCLILVTPWTVALQAPLPMEFSRQEYWSVLPFPIPGDLAPPRDRTWVSYASCISGWILYHGGTWEAHSYSLNFFQLQSCLQLYRK